MTREKNNNEVKRERALVNEVKRERALDVIGMKNTIAYTRRNEKVIKGRHRRRMAIGYKKTRHYNSIDHTYLCTSHGMSTTV